jgi:cytochrome c556
MIETRKSTRPAPPGTISGARALALVVVGLMTGIIGTVVAMTALTQRAAYGDGLMAVLQAEFGQLRRQVRQGSGCDPAEVERARSRLALLATDIPRAFPTGGSGMRQMSGELGATLAPVVADCNALPARIGTIDRACQACHAQFR